MNSEISVYKGFYVAALVPAVVLSIMSPGLGASLTDPWSIITLSALLYIPSLAITGLFGIPVFHLLRRFNLIRWWSVALAGYLGAGFTWSVFAGFRWSASQLPGFLAWSTIGCASALIVWAFWHFSDAQPGVQADRP